LTGHDYVVTLPIGVDINRLLAIDDVVERAKLLAQTAHSGDEDKTGRPYYQSHVLDVHRRVVVYGGGPDEQAAALLHDVVEDTAVTEADLLASGFSDVTVLIVHLMTKREGEPDEVYYARLRAFEPARRLKLDGDVASNGDPVRLVLVQPAEERQRLTSKYAEARRLLSDGYDLQRFVEAQNHNDTYLEALHELRTGRKQGHWMWFVFPQIAGLGYSRLSKMYSIANLDEARAYLAHEVLGPRLVECAHALTVLPGSDPVAVFGQVDAQKLQSSMTLFALAAPDGQPFQQVLDQYFAGEHDDATTRRLPG
jgi:uncharacterized protein (DUF1810 family)